MKRFILLLALLVVHSVSAGFHGGVGFSWNTIDETFESYIYTDTLKSARDHYEANENRLAPVVQLGYRLPFYNDWIAGILAEWKYLNYKTLNVGSSRGQIIPNAVFSSQNFFGNNVNRDFTSKTRLYNEVLLLGYLGKRIMYGDAYLGLGPVFLTLQIVCLLLLSTPLMEAETS